MLSETAYKLWSDLNYNVSNKQKNYILAIQYIQGTFTRQYSVTVTEFMW